MQQRLLPSIITFNSLYPNENYDMDKLISFLHQKDQSLKRKQQSTLLKTVEKGLLLNQSFLLNLLNQSTIILDEYSQSVGFCSYCTDKKHSL